VRSKLAGLPPVPVFLYDSGQDAPFTAPGLAIPTDLIAQAGGANVFAGLRQTWTSVSWEQVVARHPTCVLINDYSTPSWQQKKQFLEGFALTKDLLAVHNNCFLPLTYDQLSPGPRNAEAIVSLAQWLHPEAFGLTGHYRLLWDLGP
jgi:iron complex transport system substrate-binding protein